ncbi:MAG: transporter substrate-binding domain-containing protein [Thiolinea sp.]
MKVESLDDLIELGQPIAARVNYYYPLLSERMDQDAEFKKLIVPIETNYGSSMAKIVNQGRVLGYFEDHTTLQYVTQNNPEYQDLILYNFSLNEPQPVEIVASLKLDAGIRDKLKETHEALWNDGTITTIMKKWGSPLADL